MEVEYVPYDFFYENSSSLDMQSDNETQSKITDIIKNERHTGETLGDIQYTSDEGVPGVSVGMNRTKSISASCSVTGGLLLKPLVQNLVLM